jgi:hypothetical protein
VTRPGAPGAGPSSDDAAHIAQLIDAWWSGRDNGQALYQRLRRVDAARIEAAIEALPAYDGPPPVPAPDRPPPRPADLPEVQALRFALQDRKIAFDTIERWIRALTTGAQMLEGKRPLEWTADDVAARCAAQLGGVHGNFWSTLEAVRELWAWHPDRPYVEAQSARLTPVLRGALGPAAGDADAEGGPA